MRCEPRRGAPLADDQAAGWLARLQGWQQYGVAGGASLGKSFEFESYARTIDFVNAVARLAEAEDHHPDMRVEYRRCTLRFSTHSVGGLSLNDFICAAKVDALRA